MHRRNIAQSFLHAAKGMYYACRGERNMVTHLIIAALVIIMSFVLQLDKIEFIIILFCIAMVLITEAVNTSFEFMVDLFHGAKISGVVKMLKDIASAAVLIACVFSAIIGALIFLPKIIKS
jgi:diacylglycerol kinase